VEIARSKRVRRMHTEDEPEVMLGGLEITIVELNRLGFLVDRS
jgi:hypothetical protein